MSFNFNNFTKEFKSLTDKILTEFNTEVLPLAHRTTRLVQERIGKVNSEDISQLPAEYTALADKCNMLEGLYKKVLKITNSYETETYDYPLNLQESLGDWGKGITDRVEALTKATSTKEAQAALVDPHAGEYRPPKTFYHALSRATDPKILGEVDGSNNDDVLRKGLEIYSTNINKIANARIGQDQLIKTKFNLPLTTTLRSLISQSNNIQRKVEQKRIDYDLARVNLGNCTNPAKEPQFRVVMENAEDEFANTVEDAINIMQNVLENAKPLHEFLELIKAQLAYHKLASELLGGMVGEFESLIEENAKISNKDTSGPESGDFDL